MIHFWTNLIEILVQTPDRLTSVLLTHYFVPVEKKELLGVVRADSQKIRDVCRAKNKAQTKRTNDLLKPADWLFLWIFVKWTRIIWLTFETHVDKNWSLSLLFFKTYQVFSLRNDPTRMGRC